MDNLSQNQALREYIASLQKQLQAKSTEQQTLYRALEASQQELSVLDQIYKEKKDLNQEVVYLKAQLERVLNERRQFNEAIRELQWSRGQIVRFNELLLEKSNLLSLAQDRFQDFYQQNEILRNKMSSLQLKVSEEFVQKGNLKKLLSQQGEELDQKVRQLDQLEDKLEALSYNYVKVEQAVREKDYVIRHLKQQVQELEEELQSVRQQMGQKNIMISCLENQLEEARQTYRSQPEQELQNMLSSIPKIDLVRQANYLVQRVNLLQTENQGRILNVSFKNNQLKGRLEEVKQEFQALSQDLQL